MSDVVEVEGQEYNAADLKEAVETIADDPSIQYPNVEGRVAQVGSVVVKGDGFSDADLDIIRLADVTYLDVENNEVDPEDANYTNARTVLDAIEETAATEFEEFVEDNFSNLESIEGRAFHEGTNDFTTTQNRETVGGVTGVDIDESDDVELRYICYGDGYGHPESGDEPSLRVGLEDTRDE